jgi:hypothetical protein
VGARQGTGTKFDTFSRQSDQYHAAGDVVLHKQNHPEDNTGDMMDKEFNKKLHEISGWKKQGCKSEEFEFSTSFSKSEDGLVLVKGHKGNFEYRLKPLQELFSPEQPMSGDVNWDDPRCRGLIDTIESAIQHLYQGNPGLTDASLIAVLDKLAENPEEASGDDVIKRINCNMRMMLSLYDYSRKEVQNAFQKISASIKERN